MLEDRLCGIDVIHILICDMIDTSINDYMKFEWRVDEGFQISFVLHGQQAIVSLAKMHICFICRYVLGNEMVMAIQLIST